MAGRNFIVLGDSTTHGGVVISAWGADGPVSMTIDGIPVACIGDRVSCPKKGHNPSYIISAADGPPVTCGGKQVAREGDKCSCGAELISGGQSIASHDSGGSMADPINVEIAERKKAQAAEKAAKGIQTADATPGISAEEARLLKEQEDEKKPGFVAVFVNNNGLGHVSVFVGAITDKDRILYDPCGNYSKNGYRTGDIFTADEYDYNGYYDYHKADGNDIRVFPFKITKKEENAIKERILNPETTSTCSMSCTVRSREVLTGIGPFKNLKPSYLFMRTSPGSMADDMEKIMKASKVAIK